jgi:hypothetical protein
MRAGGGRGVAKEACCGGGRDGDGGATVEEAEPVEEPAEPPGPHQGGAPVVEEQW